MKGIKSFILPLYFFVGFVVVIVWGCMRHFHPLLIAFNGCVFLVFSFLIVVHTRRMLDSDRKS